MSEPEFELESKINFLLLKEQGQPCDVGASTSLISIRVATNMYVLHKVARPRAVGSLSLDASLSMLQRREGSERFKALIAKSMT